jgi:hypothetical protein
MSKRRHEEESHEQIIKKSWEKSDDANRFYHLCNRAWLLDDEGIRSKLLKELKRADDIESDSKRDALLYQIEARMFLHLHPEIHKRKNTLESISMSSLPIEPYLSDMAVSRWGEKRVTECKQLGVPMKWILDMAPVFVTKDTEFRDALLNQFIIEKWGSRLAEGLVRERLKFIDRWDNDNKVPKSMPPEMIWHLAPFLVKIPFEAIITPYTTEIEPREALIKYWDIPHPDFLNVGGLRICEGTPVWLMLGVKHTIVRTKTTMKIFVTSSGALIRTFKLDALPKYAMPETNVKCIFHKRMTYFVSWSQFGTLMAYVDVG